MFDILRKKKLFFLLICFLGVLFFFFLNLINNYFLFSERQAISYSDLKAKVLDNKCDIEEKEGVVVGNSLSPFLQDGRKIKILYNYYKCNDIGRGDVVVLKFGQRGEPIIKIVKGLPNDTFHLKKENSIWNIIINNEALENSEGNLYALKENDSRMLALYERDFEGKIPENALLVLGDDESGSLDSSVFGLISQDNVLGKVIF